MKKWGAIFVWGIAVTLISLLTFASIASTTNSGAFWYIFWALFVSFLWAEALHDRNPILYGKARKRRVSFMVFGAAIIGGIWALYWVSQNLVTIAQILTK